MVGAINGDTVRNCVVVVALPMGVACATRLSGVLTVLKATFLASYYPFAVLSNSKRNIFQWKTKHFPVENE